MGQQRLTADEKKTVFLFSMGGALELYDFVVYVVFSAVLSQLFFAGGDHLAGLMKVFAIFAIGYLARPLGGIILAHYGDRYGRKKPVIISILMMAVASLLIAFMPTQHTIGIFAPILLVILRLAQGFGFGGEVPGAITLITECVNKKARGLSCGYLFFGLNMGILLASLLSYVLYAAFTHAQIIEWAWRIPFAFGGLLGLVALYLRLHLADSPLFVQFVKKHAARPKLPIVRLFRQEAKTLISATGLVWLGSMMATMFFLYLPVYATSVLHYDHARTALLNSANIFLFSSLVVVWASFSDRWGRKRLFLIAATLFVVLAMPIYLMIMQQSFALLILAMCIISLVGSPIMGAYPSWLPELFSTSTRYNGIAFAYNIGFGIFGGLTPMIVTYLIHRSHMNIAPAWYLMLGAAVGLICALVVRDRHGKSLPD